jgi:hypothetical protein
MKNSKTYMVIRSRRQAICICLLLFVFYLSISPLSAKASTLAQSTDTTADFTIANGVKAIHRRVTANEVVAVQIYFRGGTRNIN